MAATVAAIQAGPGLKFAGQPADIQVESQSYDNGQVRSGDKRHGPEIADGGIIGNRFIPVLIVRKSLLARLVVSSKSFSAEYTEKIS